MKYLTSALVTIVTLFLVTNVNAQSNFKPGYIVSLNGDTTRGLIDYREWRENPQRVSFKASAEEAAKQFTAVDIKAFGADMLDHYRSYSGPITKGAVDLADLSVGIDSTNLTDNVFLRLITSGKNVSLYSYLDKIKLRYFIAEKNLAPVELKQYVYLDIKQTDKIREYNYYIQQLLSYAIKFQSGDASLEDRINRTAYKSKDIEDIVSKLNGGVTGYKISAESLGGHRFYIGAAANMVRASFFGNQRTSYIENLFDKGSKSQSVAPTIAGGVDFYLNKNVGKLLLRAEASLTVSKVSASSTSTYLQYINEIRFEDEMTINQVTVGLNPQLVYNIFNKKSFKFFVSGGAELGFWSYNNNKYSSRNYSNNVSDGGTNRALLYRTMTTAVTASTGIELDNKFSVYFGYHVPVLITNYPNYGFDISFYRLGVNYFFGGK
ncbi:porin family protein [Mucilaginibacter auburnensis]|uniref:Outer membrane protein with beta-barrel domain n=1 Tax=Mucilaginibacter auburnensis TaxID=1457233 RepID=A0A2H9VTP4_9SPHI|nr:outer membrane beta-barrel protein [Mucilaginibacter auburnensis]PJJ84190.1 outer membrane protein with beta-barrel domain [Mucilaginibacter auburnensis]